MSVNDILAVLFKKKGKGKKEERGGWVDIRGNSRLSVLL